MTGLNNIAELVALVSIFINGIFDLKSRETYTWIFLVSAIASFFFGPCRILAFIAILVILFSRDTKITGGGDIDALLVAMAGLYSTVYIVVIITLILSVVWRIFKGKEIPFVGLMGISGILSLVIGGRFF